MIVGEDAKKILFIRKRLLEARRHLWENNPVKAWKYVSDVVDELDVFVDEEIRQKEGEVE